MKRIAFLMAGLAGLMMMSCNKEQGVAAPEESKAKLELSFSMNQQKALTRAAGDAVADTESERKVNNYDIFAFRADGSLDAYYGAANPTQSGTDGAFTSGEFYVSNKTLDIYVIANGPASLKSAVTSKSTLSAAVSEFTQNTAANFVMVGYAQVNVLSLPEDNDGKKNYDGIELERITNKVVLGNVKKNFDSPALQDADVTLLGAYIVMANKSVKYTVGYYDNADELPAAADASYYNCNSDNLESNALISQAALNKTVTAAGVAVDQAYYFYPNPAVEATDASDEDFVTKLVLKVQVGSEVYFYPIGMTQVAGAARNRIYEITQVTLRRPGNDIDEHDINEYIDNAILTVDMTVKDWVSADVTGSFNGDLLN